MRPAERPLAALGERDLARLAHAADRLLWGRVLAEPGARAYRHRPGRAMEFLDYRHYLPGDDPRRIDWRASARSRQPLVRRDQAEAGATWFVLLDRSASFALDPAKWALALQLAAASAYLLLHRDFRTGLLLFDDDVSGGLPPGRGRGHYGRIVTTLETAAPRLDGGGSRPAACLARLPRRASVLLISDFLVEDAMRGDLTRLAALGGELHALQVAGADECPLPPSSTALTDVESGARLHPADPVTAQAEAQRALATLHAELTAFCRRRAIRHTVCRPRRGWRDALLAHLGGLVHGHD